MATEKHVLKYQWNTPVNPDPAALAMQKHWAAEYLRRMAGNKVTDYQWVYGMRQIKLKGKPTVEQHLMCFQFKGKLSKEAIGLKLAKDDALKGKTGDLRAIEGGKVLLH
jgi:hypothetical protein